jgi:tetratricopeptide (TPR) repeat protein
MNDPTGTLCDDERMEQVLAEAQADGLGGVAIVEEALAAFPLDPRLHFLKGSLLIGLKRFVGAHKAMSRALEIAPDYHLARFQLGFFELTSGEVDAALDTWQSLDRLPDGHWIRLFAQGLRDLAADRFAACISALRAGIAANDENPALNDDMRLVIAECEKLGDPVADELDSPEVSATSFLLGSGRRNH